MRGPVPEGEFGTAPPSGTRTGRAQDLLLPLGNGDPWTVVCRLARRPVRCTGGSMRRLLDGHPGTVARSCPSASSHGRPQSSTLGVPPDSAGPRRPVLPGDTVRYGGRGSRCVAQDGEDADGCESSMRCSRCRSTPRGPEEPAGRGVRPVCTGNVQLVTDVFAERGPLRGGGTSGLPPSGRAPPPGPVRPVAASSGSSSSRRSNPQELTGPIPSRSGCSPRRVTTRRAVRVPGSGRRTRSGLAAAP